MSTRKLDSELTAKLARRLLRCEGRPCRHASASSAADAASDDIDAQIRRRRPRPDEVALCPQLALKLASRLEKSESCDSGVSIASSSFCLTAPACGGGGGDSGIDEDASGAGCRSLPTSRRGSMEAVGRQFPAMSRRELGRLRDLFAAEGGGTDRRLGLEGVGRLLERLGAPLTHLAMRAALRDLGASGPDGRLVVGFRDFLALLGRARVSAEAAAAVAAAGGDSDADEVMPAWIDARADVASVPVEEVGVRGARGFFESQIAVVRAAADADAARRPAAARGGDQPDDEA